MISMNDYYGVHPEHPMSCNPEEYILCVSSQLSYDPQNLSVCYCMELSAREQTTPIYLVRVD